MLDWKELVRERMESSSLPAATREEIVSELAAHLEETYEAALSQALTENAAVELTLQEVSDWHVLAGKIRDAKSEENHMNYRTRTFWLPAMASILGASLAMTLLQEIGVRPHLVWTSRVAMSFYWPWLAVLPIFGALGAYLSRRAGGAVRSRVAAALAPVLWLLLLVLVTEPMELVHSGFSHLPYFGYGVANWVAIPGFALLIGALPFMRESSALPTRSTG